MTNIVREIREIASRMPHQDQATLQNAASMLAFFFGQLQEHSPKMDGTHSYRLMNHWPATHCKGRTAEEAVTAAVRAMQCDLGVAGGCK